MKIEILCIGKLKEAYWRDAVAEYSKRLTAYCDLKITELKEARLNGTGPAAEEAVRAAESADLLAHIGRDDYVITLEVKGRRLTSEQLADKLQECALAGQSSLVFVIGGSLGFDSSVSRRANLRLSFSDMTFPHQMMRVILLEQIYRGFKINEGSSYHK